MINNIKDFPLSYRFTFLDMLYFLLERRLLFQKRYLSNNIR
jgi:hypothetical protein